MKIFASLTMSFLFLFQGMSANMEVCEQIEELSHFVSHYQDHKEIDGYSFFEYVYEDYISTDGKAEKHQHDSEHHGAPCNSNHQCCQHFVFFTLFQPSLISSVAKESNSHNNYYTSQFHSRYLESPFQPPKV